MRKKTNVLTTLFTLFYIHNYASFAFNPIIQEQKKTATKENIESFQ